jgi:hypothetical protein
MNLKKPIDNLIRCMFAELTMQKPKVTLVPLGVLKVLVASRSSNSAGSGKLIVSKGLPSMSRKSTVSFLLARCIILFKTEPTSSVFFPDFATSYLHTNLVPHCTESIGVRGLVSDGKNLGGTGHRKVGWVLVFSAVAT